MYLYQWRLKGVNRGRVPTWPSQVEAMPPLSIFPALNEIANPGLSKNLILLYNCAIIKIFVSLILTIDFFVICVFEENRKFLHKKFDIKKS